MHHNISPKLCIILCVHFPFEIFANTVYLASIVLLINTLFNILSMTCQVQLPTCQVTTCAIFRQLQRFINSTYKSKFNCNKTYHISRNNREILAHMIADSQIKKQYLRANQIKGAHRIRTERLQAFAYSLLLNRCASQCLCSSLC